MPKDLRTRTLRNQTKAYDMQDQLKDEYSIMLNGKKYPLLTKTGKGFTSKASKSGKTRFNKLFNAPQSVKAEYIKSVNTALNMHDATAKTAVGDDTKNANVSTKAPQKQEKGLVMTSSLPDNKAPDSVEVFNEDKKDPSQEQQEPSDEAPAEEPQKMRKGGRVRKMKKQGGMLEGASHKQGGIPIEAEGGEFVMNKESTKHFEPQLQKMNAVGNQMRDAPQQQKPQMMNTIRQMKRKMRRGGRIYRNGGKVSEIEQPTGGRGLRGRLSQDDGKADKGMYQELINQYFTKMDFTATMKYVKNKNKDVAGMGTDALRSKAQDIASQVKTQLKYNGNLASKLKQQVYELMAIRLAMQQQPKGQKQQASNVGLVVDMESVFGDGAEIDKEQFAQKYMRGGKVDEEAVKEDMERPEDLKNIVAQGQRGEMTEPKPEQKKAFQDFQTLSAGGQQEGAITRGEQTYQRRTFNLPMALNGSVEMNWHHRYAQEIDETKEQFRKPQSLFRYRKSNTKKGRRNLLN